MPSYASIGEGKMQSGKVVAGVVRISLHVNTHLKQERYAPAPAALFQWGSKNDETYDTQTPQVSLEIKIMSSLEDNSDLPTAATYCKASQAIQLRLCVQLLSWEFQRQSANQHTSLEFVQWPFLAPFEQTKL